MSSFILEQHDPLVCGHLVALKRVVGSPIMPLAEDLSAARLGLNAGLHLLEFGDDPIGWGQAKAIRNMIGGSPHAEDSFNATAGLERMIGPLPFAGGHDLGRL